MAATQSAWTGRARLKTGGGRARAERTRNMRNMVVTLDVSQLDMSALKIRKSRKSSLMSVMAETSQLAMRPYVSEVRVWVGPHAPPYCWLE